MKTLLIALLPLLAAASASAQDKLLVVESTNDRVMLFDAFDGSLLNDNFINLLPNGSVTPINAISVNDEIWVSDQVADTLLRYTSAGVFIGAVTGGMDNIRGICFHDGIIYVSNTGTANGAPDDAVVKFDASGTNLGFFPVGDPFDVHVFNGELLVANILGDDIDRHAIGTGTFLGKLVDSDGVTNVDFPEQVASTSANTVLVAGFSPPIALFEYDASGATLNTYAVGNGNRGVHKLGNGKILYTDGNGVHVLDPATGAITSVKTGVSGRFIDPFIENAPVCYPDCDGDGVLSIDDFICFQTFFALGDPYADCDGDGVLSIDDFICFQTFFAIGC
jgi:hypothetical protein